MGTTNMIIKQEELSVIKFDEIEVRIIIQLGELWFITADVCNALEIKNVTNAIRSLNENENENEKPLYFIMGVTRVNEFVNAISESGFYKLISRSRKATHQGTFAYRFSNWVYGEVIPTIRKTGAYGVPWTFLNDYVKREKEYRIESSRRGRNLEACKKWKANLIAEEKALWAKYQLELDLM